MSEHLDDHLDIDALADVLASGDEPAHVATCPSCRARLDELGTATAAVSASLAALAPPAMPADLDARLTGALQGERPPATADVLPLTPRRARWLPALAGVAAAAAIAVGVVVLTGNSTGTKGSQDTAASGTGYAVNHTGADYTATSLAAALPSLLKGGAPVAAGAEVLAAPQATPGPSDRTLAGSFAPKTAADALAELRTPAGLARCLASLTDPSEEGLPLALDYASYQGKPALVVVLPSSKAGKVDLFVVPAGCAQADGALLYFTRLPTP